MGRRKQRVDTSEGQNKGLEPAWASSPTRPPRYVLSCRNLETNRVYVVNSYALYAIKKIFDALLDGREYQHLNDKQLKDQFNASCGRIEVGDIDIESDQLGAILTHKYTSAEAAWDLPAPYPQDIHRFLHGERITRDLEPRQQRDDRGNVVRAPKVDRIGKVTIQQICEEMKIEPRDARAALRKAKVEKPNGGWLWDAKDIDGIRKLIKEKVK